MIPIESDEPLGGLHWVTYRLERANMQARGRARCTRLGNQTRAVWRICLGLTDDEEIARWSQEFEDLRRGEVVRRSRRQLHAILQHRLQWETWGMALPIASDLSMLLDGRRAEFLHARFTFCESIRRANMIFVWTATRMIRVADAILGEVITTAGGDGDDDDSAR